MPTLQELQAERDGYQNVCAEANKRLEDPNLSYDDFKAEQARWEEANAKFAETNEEIKKLAEDQSERLAAQEKRRREEAVRKEALRIDEAFLRRPNQAPSEKKEIQKIAEQYDRDPESYDRDFDKAFVAFASFEAGVSIEDYKPEVRDAVKRLAFNPANSTIELSKQTREDWAGRIHRYYLGQNAGPGDVIDSRDNFGWGVLRKMPIFVQTLSEVMYSRHGVLNAPVTIDNSDHGQQIVERYYDDTMNSGGDIAEGDDLLNDAQGTATEMRLDKYKRRSNSVSWTWEAQRDSLSGMIPDYVPRLLGERLAHVTHPQFSNGSGVNGPQGLITGALAGQLVTTTLANGVIDTDDIVNLVENSLDDMMRDKNPEATGFMMTKATWTYLVKKKDGEGRPYFNAGWEPTATGGRRRMLEGYPVWINYDMPQIQYAGATSPSAQNKVAILFGHFPSFRVRYAYASQLPHIIRDEVSGIRNMVTRFYAVQWVDSRMYHIGNKIETAPFAVLRVK